MNENEDITGSNEDTSNEDLEKDLLVLNKLKKFQIYLSPEDFYNFISLVENHPEPNLNLKKAAAKYKKLTKMNDFNTQDNTLDTTLDHTTNIELIKELDKAIEECKKYTEYYTEFILKGDTQDNIVTEAFLEGWYMCKEYYKDMGKI